MWTGKFINLKCSLESSVTTTDYELMTIFFSKPTDTTKFKTENLSWIFPQAAH